MTDVDPEAGYVRPLSPETIAQWEREYDAAERAPGGEPAPPNANVGLALELSMGANAVRRGSFLGQPARFRPTPYPVALQLLAWEEKLTQLRAFAVADPQLDQLPEFRTCWTAILDLALPLIEDVDGKIRERMRARAYADATAQDFAELVVFLLDPGDERVAKGGSRGQRFRYDAAHALLAYLAVFGAIPGMVVLEEGRPCPASWRHFTKASAYLRRTSAERALDQFYASADLSPEFRGTWCGDQQRGAGLW